MTTADAGKLKAQAIDRAAGTEAAAENDGVVLVEWSRDAVPVHIDGIPLPSGLSSWATLRALKMA